MEKVTRLYSVFPEWGGESDKKLLPVLWTEVSHCCVMEFIIDNIERNSTLQPDIVVVSQSIVSYSEATVHNPQTVFFNCLCLFSKLLMGGQICLKYVLKSKCCYTAVAKKNLPSIYEK